ncbi:hypothetical protein P5V34_04630 [Mycobacteroides abscessus subsp. abscessus]|jgi:hypothetical protein|uniref:hypothetical protein n=1 Tax=Mycobacteroides abscessus TaxID=36809 RepID=UPI00266C1960|nr:hypothetical protein [Mycobacteroides abscessus]MDO3013272.1 hypothetical protein [Mycobacteroides abscessus subsp. abscessus]
MTARTQPVGAACAPVPTGIVAVATRDLFSHHAVCTCGHLAPRRRVMRVMAVNDAWTHASQTGCAPAVPLTGYRITIA